MLCDMHRKVSMRIIFFSLLYGFIMSGVAALYTLVMDVVEYKNYIHRMLDNTLNRARVLVSIQYYTNTLEDPIANSHKQKT
jgi:hypothetical protein